LNIVRSLGVIFFTLMCVFATAQAASADPIPEKNCGSFGGDQAAAQEYFDLFDQPESLDGNGDGVACDSPDDGDYSAQPSAGAFDEPTCGTYVNDQAAAQEYFDTHGQPDFLDGNGDGVACDNPEDGDFTMGPTAGPEDEPATGDSTDNTSGENGDTLVESLPVTGSGTMIPAAASSIALLLGMSLVVGAGALQGIRMSRR
jgi:hypothetical protein